jgi:hypothetical protein
VCQLPSETQITCSKPPWTLPLLTGKPYLFCHGWEHSQGNLLWGCLRHPMVLLALHMVVRLWLVTDTVLFAVQGAIRPPVRQPPVRHSARDCGAPLGGGSVPLLQHPGLLLVWFPAQCRHDAFPLPSLSMLLSSVRADEPRHRWNSLRKLGVKMDADSARVVSTE